MLLFWIVCNACEIYDYHTAKKTKPKQKNNQKKPHPTKYSCLLQTVDAPNHTNKSFNTMLLLTVKMQVFLPIASCTIFAIVVYIGRGMIMYLILCMHGEEGLFTDWSSVKVLKRGRGGGRDRKWEVKVKFCPYKHWQGREAISCNKWDQLTTTHYGMKQFKPTLL